MVTVEEISVFLEHPFVLLLVGAGITIGISSLLIPWFARRSEDRKKELEVKVDIETRMAENLGSVFGTVAFLIVRKKALSTSAEKDTVDDYIRKLWTDALVIASTLRSYSAEENIKERWTNYSNVLFSFLVASATYHYKDLSADEKSGLKDWIEPINEYFSDNNLIDSFSDDDKIKWERLTTDMTFDPELWAEINNKIVEQGAKIMVDFSVTRIKIF